VPEWKYRAGRYTVPRYPCLKFTSMSHYDWNDFELDMMAFEKPDMPIYLGASRVREVRNYHIDPLVEFKRYGLKSTCRTRTCSIRQSGADSFVDLRTRISRHCISAARYFHSRCTNDPDYGILKLTRVRDTCCRTFDGNVMQTLYSNSQSVQ